MNNKRIEHELARLLGLIVAIGLVVLPSAHVGATPPISGQTIEFDSTAQNVGSHTWWVRSVAVGDLDGDGDLDIVSCGYDTKVYAWQNDGTPFSGGTWTQQEVGSHTDWVQSVAVGDLDGDGDLDIVSGGGDNKVYVWRNDGTPFNGTWTQQEVGSHADVQSVAVGDLDGDGDLDIVSGGWDDKVNIWRNDGSPFNNAWTSQEVGSHTDYVQSVTVGDLDEDGDLDIVSGGWDHKVNAWQNDGSPFNGTWTRQEVGSHTSWVTSVVVGDLDRDGGLDIVSAGDDNRVNAWRNDGSPFAGTWTKQEAGRHPTGLGGVYSVAVGDLDGDGDLDIVSGGSDYKVNAWQNDGSPFNGTWTRQEVGSHTSWVTSVVVGDLDRDGDLDIVAGEADYNVNAWQNAQVHRNAPFDSTAQNVGSHTDYVLSVAVGDLDGDGDLDIVSGGAGYKVNAWQNDGWPFTNTWAKQEVGSHTEAVYSVAVGDLDGDGDLDIVSGGYDDKVNAWRNDGSPFNGTWAKQEVGSHTYDVLSVAVGDLDGDGDLDIVSGGIDDKVSAWQNDGTPFSGAWTQQEVGSHADWVRSVAVGDLDGDSDLDIVSGGDDNKVNAWQNDGTPFNDTWNWQEVGSHADWVHSVAVGDLDGAGDLDIVSGAGDTKVNAWQNDGAPFTGTWTQQEVGSHTWGVESVAMGDLDGDGDLDIVSGGFDDQVNAWQNQGGSAGLAVSDTSPDTILSGTEDDLLKVVFAHNGIAGDRDLELNTFDLDLFRSDCSTALTSAEANAIIENLRVRLDDGDEAFETDDTLVADMDSLSLASGVQTVAFSDGDANVQVSVTISKTYWISVLTTVDASSQSPNQFCVNFDPDADALVEGRSPDPPDFSVGIQDTEPTDTHSVTATGGTIIVHKVAYPESDQTFAFVSDIPGYENFSLIDDGTGTGDSITMSGLAPGQYRITESETAGWKLFAFSWSDPDGGTDFVGREATVYIDLDPGETVECTFENALAGTIIVEKQTNPNGAAGSFTFSGDAAGTISDGQQIVVSDLAPGTYTAMEDDPTPAFDLTAITCDDSNSTGDVGTRTATFNLDPGETVTCIFTNTLKQFTLTVNKAGAGTGTVTSDPAGINCGGACMENYYYDTVVTLTAVPGPYSFFVSWGEDCFGTDPITTVTMDADKACIATFGYTWKVFLPLITKDAG